MTQIFLSKPKTHSTGDLIPNKPVPTIELILLIIVMHRSSFSLGGTSILAHHLSDDLVGCEATDVSPAMDSVSSHKTIF